MNLNLSLQTFQQVKQYQRVHKFDPNRLLITGSLRGMTLVEMLVAMGVASLVIGLVVVASMTASRWFEALVNYVDMDAKSRNALDQMSLKIRGAGALTEFSPTSIKFAVPGQTNSLVYDWNSATSSLTEWNTGDSTTNTLLTGCDQLTFSLYNAALAPTTNISQSKGLSVRWNCSRTVVGRKTSEEMQQALIVFRN